MPGSICKDQFRPARTVSLPTFRTIPKDKKFYFDQPTPKPEMKGEGKQPLKDVTNTPSSGMAEIPVTPAKKTLPKAEESQLDNEEWTIIDDNGTDGSIWDEAKKKGPQNDGYAYDVKDAKPARKGWFWSR